MDQVEDEKEVVGAKEVVKEDVETRLLVLFDEFTFLVHVVIVDWS